MHEKKVYKTMWSPDDDITHFLRVEMMRMYTIPSKNLNTITHPLQMRIPSLKAQPLGISRGYAGTLSAFHPISHKIWTKSSIINWSRIDHEHIYQTISKSHPSTTTNAHTLRKSPTIGNITRVCGPRINPLQHRIYTPNHHGIQTDPHEVCAKS